MGIEDKQRQQLQKWSLLEAIAPFVHLKKNKQVAGGGEEAKKASGILDFALFANL